VNLLGAFVKLGVIGQSPCPSEWGLNPSSAVPSRHQRQLDRSRRHRRCGGPTPQLSPRAFPTLRQVTSATQRTVGARRRTGERSGSDTRLKEQIGTLAWTTITPLGPLTADWVCYPALGSTSSVREALAGRRQRITCRPDDNRLRRHRSPRRRQAFVRWRFGPFGIGLE
jgi:hypothetical protein